MASPAHVLKGVPRSLTWRCERAQRSGLSLIELLAVLVITAILASLTLNGLLVARNKAKVDKTASTIRKISETLLTYYETYETRRPRIANTNLLASRSDLVQLRQIAIRRIMAMELPDRASDITDLFFVQDGSTRVRSWTGQYATTAGGFAPFVLDEISPVARRYWSLMQGVPSVTSGDLLHLVMTRGPVADPDIVAHFRDDEIGDANGNGLREFIDAWGNPISFKRWPVGFASPLQPIEGPLGGSDVVVSTNGHRLVPLIYSAGPDKSYDIVADPGISFSSIAYDPFFGMSAAPTGPLIMPSKTALAQEVFLVPVTRVAGSGPVTFIARRMRADGSLGPIDVPVGYAAWPAVAFQTVGSERDTGGAKSPDPDGSLESLDNIHNHDLRR